MRKPGMYREWKDMVPLVCWGVFVIGLVFLIGVKIASGQEVDPRAERMVELLRQQYPPDAESEALREWIMATAVPLPDPQPNMVFVLLDDVGEEMWPWMPELDALATAGGLRFENFWAQPICSPFRASLLTGVQPHEHGIHGHLADGVMGGPLLGLSTMAELPGYSSAVVGKWHTSRWFPPNNFLGPILYGFDVFTGSEGNHWSPDDYTDWGRSNAWMWGASQQQMTVHSTAWETDEALQRVSDLPEPFLLWVSYHAAHHPFQPPGGAPAGQRAKYEALVGHLDDEVARLLGGLDLSDTYVFVISDNGTPATVTAFPGKAKGTCYEPGVRVPCVAFGPGVRVGSTDSLVGVADWMPTAWEISGAGSPVLGGEFPGVSLKSLLESDVSHHEYLFSEFTRPLGPPYDRNQRAIRGERWKLIRDVLEDVDLFFDLETDPLEQNPLPIWGLSGGQLAAYEDLLVLMDGVPLP